MKLLLRLAIVFIVGLSVTLWLRLGRRVDSAALKSASTEPIPKSSASSVVNLAPSLPAATATQPRNSAGVDGWAAIEKLPVTTLYKSRVFLIAKEHPEPALSPEEAIAAQAVYTRYSIARARHEVEIASNRVAGDVRTIEVSPYAEAGAQFARDFQRELDQALGDAPALDAFKARLILAFKGDNNQLGTNHLKLTISAAPDLGGFRVEREIIHLDPASGQVRGISTTHDHVPRVASSAYADQAEFFLPPH